MSEDEETKLRVELETIREATRELLDALAMPAGRCVARAWNRACLLNGRFGLPMSDLAYSVYADDVANGETP